ncbi:MAG: hypothetical protein NT118_03270 [Lentisphaerae bacterium]|nr:hypothetical protein [Lentisphaerota bacterium]
MSGKKKLEEKVKSRQVYYEVYAYGAGVIGQHDTLEQAVTDAGGSDTSKKITKVTREVMEVYL